MSDKIFQYKGFDIKLYKVRGGNRALIQCEDCIKVIQEQIPTFQWIEFVPRSLKAWESDVKEIIDIMINRVEKEEVEAELRLHVNDCDMQELPEFNTDEIHEDPLRY